MKNLIYILTNPAMPKLIKIGRTSNLEQEMNSLSFHAGVPVDFECHYCCEVEDGEKAEKTLHVGLGEYLKNTEKGFFEINPKKAKDFLKIWAIREVTLDNNKTYISEEKKLHANKEERQGNFRFSMVGITTGSKITFVDDPTIIATVEDANTSKVIFKGKSVKLTPISREILRKFGKIHKAAQGTRYWMFNNERLIDMRKRMDEEKNTPVLIAPDKNESPVKGSKKNSPFRFSMVNIPVGSTLTFYNSKKREPDITKIARLISIEKNQIQFEKWTGKVSPIAQKVLKKYFGAHDRVTARGPDCWIYNDEIHGSETLSQRRMRMENENKKRGLPH